MPKADTTTSTTAASAPLISGRTALAIFDTIQLLKRITDDALDAELMLACHQHSGNIEAYNNSPGDGTTENPLWVEYSRTRDLISMTPAHTLAGMVAKAQAAKAEAIGPDGQEGHEGSMGEPWAWNLVNDLVRLVDTATEAVAPDAELIALCGQFDALERLRNESFPDGARAIEDEDDRDMLFEEITKKQKELAAHIIAMPPQTLEGVQAMAKSITLWAPDMLTDSLEELGGLPGF